MRLVHLLMIFEFLTTQLYYFLTGSFFLVVRPTHSARFGEFCKFLKILRLAVVRIDFENEVESSEV